jgi:ParB family chromosome partitioning protein
MAKHGLGRGLEALLSDAISAEDRYAIRDVRVDDIVPNRYQPRQSFDKEKLAELVQSVRERGIVQPLILRRAGDAGFELVAGERRLRAAREAGLTSVPAIVREYDDESALEVALIENVQREDINAIEAAHAYQRLAAEFGLTQEQIARRVGKARPTIANTLRLLALPREVQQSVLDGEISEAHGRAVLQAAPHAQLAVWKEIVRKRMSVREAERLGRRMSTADASRPLAAQIDPLPPARDPNVTAIEEALQEALGTRVALRPSADGGRIEIAYYSQEQLEGLVERLIGPGA